jgi:signal transduction histidine kinase
MTTSLARLRLRLTLWYAGTFTLILLLLGGGLLLAIRHHISNRLDASLRAATTAVAAATGTLERERAGGGVADAVEELHIPERVLYLFDAEGRPLTPPTADAWIVDAAHQAAQTGQLDLDRDVPGDRGIRLHAERFTSASGTAYIAAVIADRLELEDQYASLIGTFAAAAFAALLLVAAGGYVLVHQSTAPVERSMEQMRRFMADAAHELRTPVTVLRTRAEVALGQERDPARDAAALQAMEQEAGRVGTIVGDLLTLARADAGERPVARAALYLDDLAASAVETVRALAERKGVALEVGAFEEASIIGDPELVRRLLLIVLDNAIKYTPAGGRVHLDVTARNGQRCVIVSDTGIGIPQEQLSHVFERFYRGEPARREADGAGLGLAIARWITDLHGAAIKIAPADAHPTPTQGTRVTLTFPAPT